MAQKKHDTAAEVGKSVRNWLPVDSTDTDTVTEEGMALVRARAAKTISGVTLRSITGSGRVVKVA